ncbi:MAG TPA: prolyl oligopeptidase family serine peptidase [Candidatus Dormibacteraeota bacterium]|nr:prolyl oligopeptidase family serine peptidase [Candidatus Dormibacteraeota bacterium]
MESLVPHYGSYADPSGNIVVIARLGWYFDMRTSAYRTIYATGSPDRFTIGLRFLEPLPKFADLLFDGDTLMVNNRAFHRVTYRQTDVTIAVAGGQILATITEPMAGGLHPGIVIVHGAETGQRYFYDVWVAIYASMGLAVLTYDKRWRGEAPTAAVLEGYAEDASAALRFLAQWPGIDPHRVGFHGGSQGGWTVPLAIMRNGQAAFAVLASAPATTVDQTDLWAGFTNGGGAAPTESTDQMLAEVRRAGGGYDPVPALRAIGVPALWLLGVNDRTVPTMVCLEIINAMRKPNFSVQLLPTGHALLVNPTGLLADDERSFGLAPEMLSTMRAWAATEV